MKLTRSLFLAALTITVAHGAALAEDDNHPNYAFAKDRPITTHRFDDGFFRVRLETDNISQPKKATYELDLEARVFGPKLEDSDTLLVTVKRGGKAMGTHRCPVRDGSWNLDHAAVSVRCKTALKLTGDGALTVDFTYAPDEGAKVPLRSLSIPVEKFVLSRGKESDLRYQAVPDDMLGSVFIAHGFMTDTNGADGKLGTLDFYFWAYNDGKDEFADSSVKCTLNGKKIAFGFDKMLRADARLRTESRKNVNADIVSKGWTRYQLTTGLAHSYGVTGDKYKGDRYWDVSQHPGAYVCTLKIDGSAARELSFTVDADGRVPHHAEETGAKGLFLAPWSSLISMKVLPSKFDERHAVKKTGFWGRAWQKK